MFLFLAKYQDTQATNISFVTLLNDMNESCSFVQGARQCATYTRIWPYFQLYHTSFRFLPIFKTGAGLMGEAQVFDAAFFLR